MTQITLQQAFGLAVQHHQAWQLAQAESLYRQILAKQPDHAGAWHLLGLLAHQAGRSGVAVDYIRRSISLQPNFPEAYGNLGTVLREMNRLDEAATACRQAIALKPDSPDVLNTLGAVLVLQRQLDAALAAFAQALVLNRNSPEGYINLGNVYKEKGQLDEAITAYRQALVLRPGFAEACSNLGTAMGEKGLLNEAVAYCGQAVDLRPDMPEGYIDLAVALSDNGQMDQALHCYRQAIALKPDYLDAHWNYALLLLSTGDFARGWDEFEWRLAMPNKGLNRGFTQKQWDGSDPGSQTILLHAEGGFGDAIQFIRLVPMLHDRHARFILECQPALVPLLAQIAGIDQIVARGELLPPFDLHIPLQSLPRILGITLDNIPNKVPYLQAPEDRLEKWALRVAVDGQLNVGLVWSGSLGDQSERTRTIDTFQQLGNVKDVRFFSLQLGPESRQMSPDGLTLVDLTGDIQDFADTAALLQQLDLIISVDTSTAHLAGALGRPVWVLIPRRSDFRWLLNRNDSPWYPTMRLFRQTSRGDWQSAIAELKNELHLYVASAIRPDRRAV